VLENVFYKKREEIMTLPLQVLKRGLGFFYSEEFKLPSSAMQIKKNS